MRDDSQACAQASPLAAGADARGRPDARAGHRPDHRDVHGGRRPRPEARAIPRCRAADAGHDVRPATAAESPWREPCSRRGAPLPRSTAVEGATTGKSIVETGAGPIVRASARVSPGMFAMLGARPIRGRAFDATEGRAGSDDRVLLSEDLWRSAFGGDPDLVGRWVTIDGAASFVVGIMPREFRFPEWNTVVWKPLDFAAPPPALAGDLPQAFVRLAPGVPESDAMRIATDAARRADATLTTQMQATPRPLAGATPGFYDQRAIPLLAGGVALVFLVLCANVCSLLLARLTARQREFHMCAALGASRAAAASAGRVRARPPRRGRRRPGRRLSPGRWCRSRVPFCRRRFCCAR